MRTNQVGMVESPKNALILKISKMEFSAYVLSCFNIFRYFENQLHKLR